MRRLHAQVRHVSFLVTKGRNFCQVTAASSLAQLNWSDQMLLRWLGTGEEADWLHASKNIPFLSWHSCQYDRPHWGGHQPSDPAGRGHLRGFEAVEGCEKSPKHTFPRVGSRLGCRTHRFLLRSLLSRSWLQDCKKWVIRIYLSNHQWLSNRCWEVYQLCRVQ